MQKRVAQHAEEVMEKMAQERELTRKEFQAEMDELSAKVGHDRQLRWGGGMFYK